MTPGGSCTIPADQPYIEIIETNTGKLEGAIPLTNNLRDALFQFRQQLYPNDENHFWIDAICIRQDKEGDEKNGQIQNMAKIFAFAETVRIWLGWGDDRPEDDLAWNCINQVLALVNIEQYSKDKSRAREWMAFHNLIHREWFSRRWILQEVLYARKADVYWGDKHISWPNFAAAVSLLDFQHDALQSLLLGSAAVSHDSERLRDVNASGAAVLIRLLGTLFRTSGDGEIMECLWSLEMLLVGLTAFKCVKPHDSVYAIMQLSKDAIPVVKSKRRGEIPTVPAQGTVPNQSEQSEEANALHSLVDDSHLIRGRSPRQGDSLSSRRTNYHARSRPRSVSKAREAAEEEYDAHVKRQFVVDYQKSVLALCTEVIEFVKQRSKSIDIICKSWAPDIAHIASYQLHDDDMITHPSWIQSCTYRGNGSQHGTDYPNVDTNGAQKSSRTTRSHRGTAMDPFVGTQVSGMQTYSASANIPPRHFKIESRILSSLGFILDEIVEAYPSYNGDIPATWLKVGEWRDPFEPTVSSSDIGEPPDRLWRTLVGNRFSSDGPQRLPAFWKQACRLLFQSMPKGKNSTLSTDRFLQRSSAATTSVPKAALPFVHRMRAVVWGRAMIKTRGRPIGDHSIGLAPSQVEQGDLICILYGCSVPVVLRRLHRTIPGRTIPKIWSTVGETTSSTEQNANNSSLNITAPDETQIHQLGDCRGSIHNVHGNASSEIDLNVLGRPEEYSLIGECYVHGMMDAEAFSVQEEHRIKDSVFHIGCAAEDCNCDRCQSDNDASNSPTKKRKLTGHDVF